MAYTVKITYLGVETDPERIAAPICRIFAPTNSYIDTVAYTEGYHNSLTTGDIADVYGKSIYATNVDGWGSLPEVEPFASTSIPFPVPLAQFKMAVVGGTDNSVSFDVEDYKEAFYYMEVGKALEDQGFQVKVTPKN